jgi:hypothetical protein
MTGKYVSFCDPMNITEKLAQRVLLPLLVILIIACNPQDKTITTKGDKSVRAAQCIAQQSQCQFELSGGQVQVLFDVDKIIAEQSFNMIVHYHGAETITSIKGYLEGVEMYMGKIPLFIEAQISENSIYDKEQVKVKPLENETTQLKANLNSSIKPSIQQTFQADVLVGSCSAQIMTWRIWLTFTTSENKTYTKMLTVQSYRS